MNSFSIVQNRLEFWPTCYMLDTHEVYMEQEEEVEEEEESVCDQFWFLIPKRILVSKATVHSVLRSVRRLFRAIDNWHSLECADATIHVWEYTYSGSWRSEMYYYYYSHTCTKWRWWWNSSVASEICTVKLMKKYQTGSEMYGHC